MRGPVLSSLVTRPPLWREARIGLEAAALVRDPIFRGDGVADGRGRPVLLIPGFLAGDGSLSMMAGWLKRTGHRPSRAGIVSNVNCAGVLMPRLERRLDRQGARAPPPRPRLRSGRARLAAGRAARGASARAASGRGREPARVARRSRAVQALVHRRRVLLDLLARPRAGASARCAARVGLLEERRRRRLARLPRPGRDRAGRDQGVALRDGRVARGVARRRSGSSRVRRPRRATPRATRPSRSATP